MSGKLIKCRKGKYCDGCTNFIKYGEVYKKCVEFIDSDLKESIVISFCMECHEKHILEETECKKGNHDFIEKVDIYYDNGVPYPEYTDEYVCDNCGINKKEI